MCNIGTTKLYQCSLQTKMVFIVIIHYLRVYRHIQHGPVCSQLAYKQTLPFIMHDLSHVFSQVVSTISVLCLVNLRF